MIKTLIGLLKENKNEDRTPKLDFIEGEVTAIGTDERGKQKSFTIEPDEGIYVYDFRFPRDCHMNLCIGDIVEVTGYNLYSGGDVRTMVNMSRIVFL